MKDRRSLIEGLTQPDPAQHEREKAFVYGTPVVVESDEPETSVTVPTSITEPSVTYDSKVLPQFAGRVPVTTRTRPEVATALKRASLTRQLNGIEPYYVQDIMEAALEAWLRSNGYLA